MTSENTPVAPTPEALAPTRTGERVTALDAIRGFALFGILLVNLQVWFRSTPLRYEVEPNPWPGLLNKAVDAGMAVFFDGKFMSLFSMLFGVGLAIQMERAEARGARFGWFALRRLGSLFLLGVAHIALIWSGDILHIYALNGALLLLFLRRKTKTVAIWAATLTALPIVVGWTFAIVFAVLGKGLPPPDDLGPVREAIANTVRIYQGGTWLEIATFRFSEYVTRLPSMVNTIPIAFMGFLVGLTAWKAGIVKRASEHLPILRKTLVIGLLFGLSASVARVYLESMPKREVLLPFRLVITMYAASAIALALAYAAGILLLAQKEAWKPALSALGNAGCMALTNYLLQSVLCSFVFYGFGLGLYDRLGPAAALLVVFAIYAFQLVLSAWWLRRFRFGPVEWLWRSMTYGALQPMRAPRDQATTAL